MTVVADHTTRLCFVLRSFCRILSFSTGVELVSTCEFYSAFLTQLQDYTDTILRDC